MDSRETAEAFATLSTPALADACLRIGMPPRLAPPGLRPVLPGTRAAGRALPARHAGSVDVFLEALVDARPGDVLVIDNAARSDEACIGDLVALEAKAAGLSGILVWGLHRDTSELAALGPPVWSYGATPVGPRRVDPRPANALTRARFGDESVGAGDLVFADEDGAVFLDGLRAAEVLETASRIARTEREQARRVREGRTLSEQFRFADFLEGRAARPGLTFREHLKAVGGAIEV
ncbi:MAG TPA: RraA family protein [Thermoanaerobaculia bacterium]|nr:RraA family protein [Thermoanaerobaculia bacterium]